MDMLLRRHRTTPADHSAFAGLDVTCVPLHDGKTHAAVHIRGKFEPGRPPLVCLAGYHRNMADFSGFLDILQKTKLADWPLILVDFPGRGRADDRSKIEDYNSLNDVRDLEDVLASLGIGRAIFFGQGHGGQIAMLYAARHPTLIAGTVLVDAGPVTDSRGLVRLRSNIAHIASWQGQAVSSGFRRILGGDYPELSEVALDSLAKRTHSTGKKGRALPLFDERLIKRLDQFDFDDILVPQWQLFDTLQCAPLLIFRTQLTDLLRREIYEEMVRRRPDATALTISGQGSPALFEHFEEVETIVSFIGQITQPPSTRTRR
ncbi:alpha/beta fold hydrolase [Devosia sp. WQ 349K1]|uniref:alpha/beta fold hydrolase n=1 Tax=Devosia sp. WQ 349K1 TaxID=2800329 RepID=UPI00349FBB23